MKLNPLLAKIFLFAGFIILPLTAFSQTASEKTISSSEESLTDSGNTDYALKRKDIEFAVEYGIAPNPPTNFSGPKEYNGNGRKLNYLALKAGYVFNPKKYVTIEYLVSVSPIVAFGKNEVKNPAYVSPNAAPIAAPTIRKTTYAHAVQPAILKFMFLAKKRVKPFAQIGGGFLYAHKPVPVPDGRRFNFTADFGGGVMYMLKPKRALNFGYKYLHISNGGRGYLNPGYNANVFYAGYSFFLR